MFGPQQLMKKPSETTSKNLRKLFVGGIGSLSSKALVSYFKKFGAVEKSSVILDRNNGKSRGFGFITMQSSEDIPAILEHSHTLNGKVLECKLAYPKQNKNLNKRGRKIFVGGLMPSVTLGVFNEFFEQFGVIQDSVVMVNKVTGKPRGFGFVTFGDQESVEEVLRNYDVNAIGGKWVQCKRAAPKEECALSEASTVSRSRSSSIQQTFQDMEDLCISLVEDILNED